MATTIQEIPLDVFSTPLLAKLACTNKAFRLQADRELAIRNVGLDMYDHIRTLSDQKAIALIFQTLTEAQLWCILQAIHEHLNMPSNVMFVPSAWPLTVNVTAKSEYDFDTSCASTTCVRHDFSSIIPSMLSGKESITGSIAALYDRMQTVLHRFCMHHLPPGVHVEVEWRTQSFRIFAVNMLTNDVFMSTDIRIESNPLMIPNISYTINTLFALHNVVHALVLIGI
jgi:hypothetical protein